MKYYLVKETNRAIENGKVLSVAWFGKYGTTVAIRHAYEDVTPKQVQHMVKAYGYKRECDARRSFCYLNASHSKFYTSEVCIVSEEI